MRRLLLLLATLSFAASGCGGGDDEPAATTTTAAPTTTSTTPTTLPPTTNTTLPVTTTTDPLKNGGESPQMAAEGLYNAWIANSKAGALSWADKPVVDILLNTSYQNAVKNQIEFMGCDFNAGFNNAMACSYRYEGGSMHFLMSKAVGKWRVVEIKYVAD
jgi:hypothetical protein